MKETVSGVYKIENVLNGKVYVGSSKDIYTRFYQHKNLLNKNKHHCRYLQHSWNQHGEKSFTFEIIEITNQEQKTLQTREQYYMDVLKCYNPDFGFNSSKNSISPKCDFATLRDLKDGKYKISKNSFEEILYYLCKTKMSIPKIAKTLNVCERTIYQIYFKVNYKELTKDCIFLPRENKGEDSSQAKLTEEIVIKIIKLLQEDVYIVDISKMFNISNNMVSDILHHKTWKHLTKDIVFNEYKKASGQRRSKPVKQYTLDGIFIKEFESAREAEKQTKISYKLISRVCTKEREHTHGFKWSF